MSLEVKKDEIKKLLADIQTDIEAKGVKRDERIDALTEEFSKKSQAISDLTIKLEAEEKSRQELELALARVGEVENDVELKSSLEFKKAFESWARTKIAPGEEVAVEEYKKLIKSVNSAISDEAVDMEVKKMLVGSQADGGIFVPVDMQSRIITRNFETSPIRAIANIITTSLDTVEYVIDDQDNIGSGWVGETDLRSETTTNQFGAIEIPVNEIYAEPFVTQKLLDDSVFNVENYLSGRIADKFSRQENTAFVSGSGIKQPKGILTYADWTTLAQYERNALETRETATASTLAGDDLVDLQTDLLEVYQNNARWGMTRKTWAEVIQLKDSQGQYLLNPAMLFAGPIGLQLLGRPVVLMSDLQSLSDGNVPIIYGDFREGYTIVDRFGIRLIRDNVTQKGVVKYYTTKRVGGRVTNFQAIKRLKVKSA